MNRGAKFNHVSNYSFIFFFFMRHMKHCRRNSPHSISMKKWNSRVDSLLECFWIVIFVSSLRVGFQWLQNWFRRQNNLNLNVRNLRTKESLPELSIGAFIQKCQVAHSRWVVLELDCHVFPVCCWRNGLRKKNRIFENLRVHWAHSFRTDLYLGLSTD